MALRHFTRSPSNDRHQFLQPEHAARQVVCRPAGERGMKERMEERIENALAVAGLVVVVALIVLFFWL